MNTVTDVEDCIVKIIQSSIKSVSMKTVTSCVISIMMMFACKKEIRNTTATAIRRNDVAALTKEVSEDLQQVYADHLAYLEVNAAILSGTYYNERVPLKDLLLKDTGKFRSRFCQIVERGDYPVLTAQLTPVLNLDNRFCRRCYHHSLYARRHQ